MRTRKLLTVVLLLAASLAIGCVGPGFSMHKSGDFRKKGEPIFEDGASAVNASESRR